MARVAQVDRPEARKDAPVAAIARRHHAVEHVDTARDRLEQVVGGADAHQIARLVARQRRRDRLDHRQHHLLRLANREAANRVTGKANVNERARVFEPQSGIIAALHDAEQRPPPRRTLEGALATLRPGERQPHRALDRRAFCRQLQTFVELHHDVGAEQVLHLDGALGR